MKKFLFLFLLTNCSYMEKAHEKRIWSHAHEYVGEYKINMVKSDFSKFYTDTGTYKNLILKINQDTTFEFSQDLPFITAQKGKWIMDGDDMSERCVFTYGQYNYDHVLRENNELIYIKYPRGKKNMEGANLLYFDRVK